MDATDCCNNNFKERAMMLLAFFVGVAFSFDLSYLHDNNGGIDNDHDVDNGGRLPVIHPHDDVLIALFVHR